MDDATPFVPYLILGAGPTGLGAAHRLVEADCKEFLVLEASDRVGGLAKTFRDSEGFLWDAGGHALFSRYTYFDALLERVLPQRWDTSPRASSVWLGNRFVPFPVQSHLQNLRKEDAWQCLETLLAAAPTDIEPPHLAAWLQRTFGAGLADLVLRPYAVKRWALPVEKLAAHWAAARIAVPDRKNVLRSLVLGSEAEKVTGLRISTDGGTGSLWEGLADLVGRERIRLNAEVMSVDLAAQTVECAGRSRFRFGKLLSTIPLDSLCAMAKGLPEKARKRAQSLVHVATNVVGLGIEGVPPETLRGQTWLYFPEPAFPFHRATVLSNLAPTNVAKPGEQWSLLLEISETAHKPIDRDRILDQTVEALRTAGFLAAETRLLSKNHLRFEYGSPVPTLDRDAALEEILPALEKFQVFGRGRFGAWKYEVGDQDHALMQGVEWAEAQLFDASEETVHGQRGLGGDAPATKTSRKKAA